MYDRSLIDEINKKADIVTVVGSYLKLIKKGRIYVALCPFHDDSNPSLQVNPERNTFHCFVDNHSGSAISFVMQYEHIGFVEAVKKVADIIGFDDPRLHTQVYVKKVDETLKPLFACINDLSLYYEYALNSSEGENASNYLEKRNINSEMTKKFHIGYSPIEGNKTIKFLQSKGHSLKTIEDIGVALNKGLNTRDNNQGRLIFAITNNEGNIVGFSARKIDNSEGPKYINSPETKLFTKGNILYNFSNAKTNAKVSKYIYLLEGFMDVIALDKIKEYSAVALMGTALSKDHIKALKSLNVEVRMCLDGDLPGQEATLTNIEKLLDNNIPVRIVNNLNSPKDPDEILNSEGEEALKKYLNNLLTPFNFTINFYKYSKKLSTSEDKKNLIKYFMPLMLATRSSIELDDYIFKLSEITDFSSNAIKKAIINARNKKNNKIEANNDIDPRNIISTFHPEKKELRHLEKAEREILFHMLGHEDAIKFYETYIESFYTKTYRDLSNFLIDYINRNKEINISGLINEIEMSDVSNKEALKNELELILNENTHLKYSNKLMENCKSIIEKEKKSINKKEMILRATEGKSEEEKARIIADSLRIDN